MRTFAQYIREGMWDTEDEDEDYGADAETLAKQVADHFNNLWKRGLDKALADIKWEPAKITWRGRHLDAWIIRGIAPSESLGPDHSGPGKVKTATVANITVEVGYRGLDCRYSVHPDLTNGKMIQHILVTRLEHFFPKGSPFDWAVLRHKGWY